MEFEARERLLRRIVSKKLYTTFQYNGEDFEVLFQDPSLDTSNQANYIYSRYFNNNKDNSDFITLEESYNILKKDNKWSDTKDLELIQLQRDIATLEEKLPTLRFKKIEQRHISKSIEKAQKRIQALESEKNQLSHLTLEHFALQEKRKFIIRNITKFLMHEPKNWQNNERILSHLAVYYFQDNIVSMKDLRELARTDPWRLYWTVSKDSNLQLFPHSSVEMSDWQYLLVFWSKVYDLAFAHSNPPTENVINDDNLFDAWYKNQAKQKDINIPNDVNISGVGVQEVFLMADEEGAKEVLEMNNPLGLNRIQNINKLIKEHGEVNEVNLPDIQRELRMAANQAMPPK